MHIDDESPRWARFRRLATRSLTPLTVALPLALLVASAGLIIDRDGDRGWGNFAVIVITAAALLVALVVLRTLRAAAHARGAEPEFSRRDSVILGFFVACTVSWTIGAAGMAGLPNGIVASAFIHGMFGAGVTLALLIASAARRPAASA